MTTIEEETAMDFINWDAAGAETGFDLQPPEGVISLNDEANIDLVLGDVEGDDSSFWALQHFEQSQAPQDFTTSVLMDPMAPMAPMAGPLSAQMYWETPEIPCSHCALGGYQCKLIQEGTYKGYCTTCVALRCECSFGPPGNIAGSEAGAAFPADPWPTMGDRPETSIVHEDDASTALNAVSGLKTSTPVLGTPENLSRPPSQPISLQPKIGARFSRESVRVLKNWVSTHGRHPYPTEEEKESLQRITGLSKTQITNWLANARRRGKIQPTRSISPHVGRGYATAMEIPRRRGTPALFEHMDPLQRWANSPPENEPASVTDIARAVTASSNMSSSSGLNSPYISGYSEDDGSSRSLCNQSSASSWSISQSSNNSSAFSHQSRGSFGSIPSFVRSNRGRRRRRRAPLKPAEETLNQPLKTFQCTFCTETFRTKHDWQRHEKSLHLSLERWVCSPDGPTNVNPETGAPSCVFCGLANPDEAHIESHNHSACQERTIEERTFYRKDHLRQHLKLVHNVKFLQWSMEKWKVASPQIRSRCGFCGIVMDSWSIRVDHLAEHFKTGNTMADWKGDWGFEAPVLEMVENSIPPYLIDDERNSPLPFVASQAPASTPNNAYELLKMELQYWRTNWIQDNGREPTDDEMQHEACRVVFGSEFLSRNPSHRAPSWLRDLVLSKEENTVAAKFKPVRTQAENRISELRVNGKDNIFEFCELELQLDDFVRAKRLLGLTPLDYELQVEACKIIGRMEEKSSTPCEEVANWLLRLIYGSTSWLADFRRRASLPRSEDLGDPDLRSKDPKTIDSTIHNYTRLERELAEYIQAQRSLGYEPDDADLQKEARVIVYDSDDEWNQTAADDAEWLGGFRKRHPPHGSGSSPSSTVLNVSPADNHRNSSQLFNIHSDWGVLTPSTATGHTESSTSQSSKPRMKTGAFFLNDANCYRRLSRSLRRFVAATMSPNNPNSHIPTDQELQHQARWIVYDDDDPWNQTAADNAEWLMRFKRDVGILPIESGPGLGTDVTQWNASGGGTGFAPPYVYPNPNAAIEPLNKSPKIFCRDNSKPFEPSTATANHFLQNFTQRYPPPPKVFCSRELENGLHEYVKRELHKSGVFPSDEQMRVRARAIMAMEKTPADDPVLLGKFKASLQHSLAEVAAPTGITTTAEPLLATTATMPPTTLGMGLTAQQQLPSTMPMDMDLSFTEQDLNDLPLVPGVELDFSDGAFDELLGGGAKL